MNFIKKASVKITFFILLVFLLFTNCEFDSLFDPVQTSNDITGNNPVISQSQYLYVLHSPWFGNGSVTRIDLKSNSIISNFITVGNVPNDIKFYKNKLYIPNVMDNNIQIYDLLIKRSEYVKNIISPEFVQFYNKYFIVSSMGVVNTSDDGKVYIYNVKNNQEVTTIENLKNPYGIMIYQDYLFIADNGSYYGWGDPNNYIDSKVIIVNLNDFSIVKTLTGFVNAFNFTIDNYGNIYVVTLGQYDESGKIYVIDGGSFKIEKEIAVSADSGCIDFAFDNNILVGENNYGWPSAGGLYLINLFTGTVVNGVANPLIDADISSILYKDNSNIGFICDNIGNNIYKYDINTKNIKATYNVNPSPLTFDIGDL